MNDREFSDIEIFQRSGKGIPLFMIGHKNCLQADYLLGPGPRLIKKRIYRAAVSQKLNTGLHNISLTHIPNCGKYFTHFSDTRIPILFNKELL
jgi:hypothetical protein